ncbi:MAG: hypothetical protein Mars2KO_43120 [Maribacter sp.]
MEHILGKNYTVTVVMVAFMVLQSCNSEIRTEDYGFYLWDLKEKFPHPVMTQVSIENKKIYFLDYGDLKFRKLKVSEIDSLNLLASELNAELIDSTYYRHLSRYDYMFDFTVIDGVNRLSTSVYDSVIPKKLEYLYDYIKKISDKKNMERVVTAYPNLNHFYLTKLINNKGDTIVPSNETFFRINKKLLNTSKQDWTKNKSKKIVKYEILVEHTSGATKYLEILGISEDNSLFFKFRDDPEYYSTNFDYEVRLFPKLIPEISR